MVVEGEKTRRSVLTFYFLFRSYSSLLSVSHIKFSHMMTRFVVSAKPPDCREVTSSPAAATLISHVHQKKKKNNVCDSTVCCYDCARVCVRVCVCVCVLIQAACRSVSAVRSTRLERLLSVATLLTFGR